jgi:hypothetical protein
MAGISKAVRDAVRERLADESIGFNTRFAELAGDYGVDLVSIDWGPHSRQFFQGALDRADLEDTTATRGPMVALYVARSANGNLQKFCTFSGTVTVGLDFHLTWRQSRAGRDYESLGDAIEEAIFRTFNETEFGEVVYNGDLSLERSPVEKGGEHWIQTLTFAATFEVHTY